MKNLLKSVFASMAIFAAVVGCEKGPQGYPVDGSAVVLEAYGPNPVLRGAELKFIGRHLSFLRLGKVLSRLLFLWSVSQVV